MEREEFERRLATMTGRLLALNRRLMLEQIPDEPCFDLAIGPWGDLVPLEPREVVDPEDPRRFPEAPRRRLAPAELVAALWRAGRVPRWIDVVVVAVVDGRAVVRTDASPRFTDDRHILDNPHNEDSPFVIKTVGAPPWIARTPTRVPLERYSLSWQADPEAARRAYAGRPRR